MEAQPDFRELLALFNDCKVDVTVTGLGLKEHFERLACDLLEACRRHYGARLVSVVLYGSAGRGTQGPESDLDVLVVAEALPRGRLARVEDFAPVEAALEPRLAEMRSSGFSTEISPVFKTPEEVAAGSPLFLDMTEDALILHDREGFFAAALDRLRGRLKALGSRRVWCGNAWYWDLKPDYKPGEEFEL